jgi:hypothetical protein
VCAAATTLAESRSAIVTHDKYTFVHSACKSLDGRFWEKMRRLFTGSPSHAQGSIDCRIFSRVAFEDSCIESPSLNARR